MTAPDPWAWMADPPRRWQVEALPLALAALRRGERGIVSACMGAGKSALSAALVRIATAKLDGRIALVTVPSKALVEQTADDIRDAVPASEVGVYYGPKKQVRPVIVACNASVPRLYADLAGRGKRVAFILADEAHKVQAEVMREVLPRFQSPAILGLTATPYRSIPAESIELFSTVIYRYTLQDAVADGVLVPFRHVRVVGLDDPLPLDEQCLAMMQAACADLGPGIVSAANIPDAEAYAAWLSARDWSALAIHSRMSDAERTARLHALQAGDVRCLVHVSLLAEGVDFPWLRWLCMRRKVQARVRFLQELGRPLRSHPGKVEAVILDPHLLLGRHGLTTIEAVGQVIQDAADAEADETGPRAPGELGELEAVALDLLLDHLGAVHRDLLGAGIVQPRELGDSTGWQLADVSARQVEAVKGASKLTRHIPADVRPPIRALVGVPWALTRGQASTLLDVLYGGARWARSTATIRGEEEWWRLQWSPSAAPSAPTLDPGDVRLVRLAGDRAARAAARGAA